MRTLVPKTCCGLTDLETGGIILAKIRGVTAFVSFLFLLGRSLEIVPKYAFVENTMEQISPFWIWPWVICTNEMIASYALNWAIQKKSRMALLAGPAWTATLATMFFCLWLITMTLTIHVASYDKWRLAACLMLVDVFLMLRVAIAIYELFLIRALYMKWKYDKMTADSDSESGIVDSDGIMVLNISEIKQTVKTERRVGLANFKKEMGSVDLSKFNKENESELFKFAKNVELSKYKIDSGIELDQLAKKAETIARTQQKNLINLKDKYENRWNQFYKEAKAASFDKLI